MNENDLFASLEEEFSDNSEQLFPLISDSVDPIDCAIRLHEYTENISDNEDRMLTIRRGLSRLTERFYAKYMETMPLEILTTGALAIPEENERVRRRDVTHPIGLPGHVFARGKLSSIRSTLYVSKLGEKRSFLTLSLVEPYILDDFSNVKEDIQLPDYLITPVSSVIRYAFLKDRDEN